MCTVTQRQNILFCMKATVRFHLPLRTDLHQHTSIVYSKENLRRKLQIFESDQIDVTARFQAFNKSPTRLHPWASKSFCNFSRTAKRICQHSSWQDDTCRCCNADSENDVCHILTRECDLLDTCRERILEDFASNCASLDRDRTVLTVLVSFVFNDPSSPPPT